jgi:mono/diheme cytochrome c family protein
MADADVADLIAYLRALPPVRRENQPHEVTLPLPRLAYRAWRLLFVRSMDRPAAAPVEKIARGRYLADHVAICGDCHTPRNSFGVPNQSLYMAGSPKDGPIGERVPNITPDKETGIGDWKRDEIAELLLKGVKPDFDNVQGLMEEVIRGTTHGYKDMTKEDALAIADYLKSIPAIKNVIK